MGIKRTILRRLTNKLWVRTMNRIGHILGRVVDTSADAPEHGYAPKRDVYVDEDASTTSK